MQEAAVPKRAKGRLPAERASASCFVMPVPGVLQERAGEEKRAGQLRTQKRRRTAEARNPGAGPLVRLRCGHGWRRLSARRSFFCSRQDMWLLRGKMGLFVRLSAGCRGEARFRLPFGFRKGCGGQRKHVAALKRKGATVKVAPFGNRTPGNNRYRCFLSDLAGLAARPPSGSLKSLLNNDSIPEGPPCQVPAGPAPASRRASRLSRAVPAGAGKTMPETTRPAQRPAPEGRTL